VQNKIQSGQGSDSTLVQKAGGAQDNIKAGSTTGSDTTSAGNASGLIDNSNGVAGR